VWAVQRSSYRWPTFAAVAPCDGITPCCNKSMTRAHAATRWLTAVFAPKRMVSRNAYSDSGHDSVVSSQRFMSVEGLGP
jgi:hypothetical protein